MELEELVEHFTLYPDETRLLRNKSGGVVGHEADLGTRPSGIGQGEI